MLGAGKHCFVEKPLAQTVAGAERAVAAADAAGASLMVGHLLEYHPGIAKLKEIADGGELGEIHYIYSNRLNLGKLRADENALWSLGAHDVSVLLHLAGEEPYEVEARGESYMRQGIEDVVFGFLRFPSGLAAHLHLSWLDPHKERRFTVVGSRRMATFDDMDLERKVTVYDKGFDQPSESWGEYITRSGDIWSPSVPNREPLRVECEHFVACLREGRIAGLRRPLGAARRARAGRAAGAARQLAPGAACSRLTARRGCCWARTCGSARTFASAPTSSSMPGPWSATAARSRTARSSASRRSWRPTRPRRARRRRRCVLGAGAVVCARAIVFAGAEVGERSDPRRPVLRPRARADRGGHAWSGADRRSTTTSSSARACACRPTST